MIENISERRIEVSLRGSARRRGDAVQQQLGSLVVMIVERNHGAAVIAIGIEPGTLSRLRRIGPACEGVRESFDGVLRVGGKRVAGTVDLGRAVRIQLHESNREQLHHFACVIFIGRASVAAIVVGHVEIVAHRRTQGDVLQQR